MGNNESNHDQASLSDHLVYVLYRGFECFLRLLPMEFVCIIGATMGQVTYFLMPRRRQIVLRNLRIVHHGRLSPRELNALARKTFRTSGLNLVASITASTLTNKEIIERVEVVGREHLLNALANNQGCILLLGHMGNWEVLTQLKTLVPEIKSPASLYRPLNNPLLNRLVKRRRQSRGAALFNRFDGFTKPITLLKSGGFLGVIADQSAGKHGMPVPLYGKLASMTNLPALLHRKTKAPILPVSMCTVSPGRWKVVVHPALEVSADELKDTYKVTARCAKAYEQLMNESPADVLWMHNYWRGANRTALKIRGSVPRNMKPADLSFTVPFYLLIYIPMRPANESLGEVLRYLRSCRPDFHITLVGSIPPPAEADTTLPVVPDEPPHLAANAIRNYEASLPAPFDCALDLSLDGTGTTLLTMAGIDKIFALKNEPPVGGHDDPANYQARLESFITRISPAPE
ncbi:MAG: lysophospholipid acyltransferase family protein [Akkermansiaceae bacterium]|nr:lysophospholipid acyltransferase family protein [Akkermansiaceae bacterium]